MAEPDTTVAVADTSPKAKAQAAPAADKKGDVASNFEQGRKETAAAVKADRALQAAKEAEATAAQALKQAQDALAAATTPADKAAKQAVVDQARSAHGSAKSALAKVQKVVNEQADGARQAGADTAGFLSNINFGSILGALGVGWLLSSIGGGFFGDSGLGGSLLKIGLMVVGAFIGAPLGRDLYNGLFGKSGDDGKDKERDGQGKQRTHAAGVEQKPRSLTAQELEALMDYAQAKGYRQTEIQTYQRPGETLKFSAVPLEVDPAEVTRKARISVETLRQQISECSRQTQTSCEVQFTPAGAPGYTYKAVPRRG